MLNINEAYNAEQLKFDFLEKHPLIRQISDYDNITKSRELFHVKSTSQ